MIRDPSDGSVREKPDVELPCLESAAALNVSVSKSLLATSTSGLPTTANAKYLVRLDESRDWLKDYFKRE